MSRFPTAILIVTAAFSTGCDEKARDFARNAKLILDHRSQQLSRKIAAEKAAYGQSAVLAAEDHRNLIDSALRNERNERSDELAADYDEGRKPVSLWRKHLSEYARIDYAQNRDLLTADMDANTRYLQRFEDLKIEQDKVDALGKILASLAKKSSFKEDVEALGDFAADTNDDFEKKVCTQLKSQRTGTGDQAKAAKKSYDDKQCDDVLKPPK